MTTWLPRKAIWSAGTPLSAAANSIIRFLIVRAAACAAMPLRSEPEDAAVRVDTTGRTIDDALGDVLDHLYDAGYLHPTVVEPVETPKDAR